MTVDRPCVDNENNLPGECSKKEQEVVVACQNRIGYRFANPRLLLEALTHPSYAGERPIQSYQRLEFLGDAVLGALVSTELYHRFPNAPEGELTQSKISLVSGRSLAKVGEQLDLAPCLLIGNSEACDNYRGLTRALEDVFEAIVGAIYLDGGFEAAQTWVLNQLSEGIEQSMDVQVVADPKSHLQALLQSSYKKPPVYEVIHQDGPAHNPQFTSSVSIDDLLLGVGTGTSKKMSQVQAAVCALEHINAHQGRFVAYTHPKE